MKTLEKISGFAGNTFAVWVIVFAILAYFMPDGFAWIAPHVPLLLGIIMFGMGLTLSFNDFKGVVKTPKSVLIGVIAQYTIMPLLAYLLAITFQLPAEVAVGDHNRDFHIACTNFDTGLDLAACQQMAACISR